MIKNILVPTDFSSCAMNAIHFAAHLAKDIKAEQLHIMHAYAVPMAYTETGINTAEDLIQKQQEEIQEYFDTLEDKVPELKNLKVNTVNRQQLAVDGITGFSEEENIDLIIMGTKGSSGIEEVLLGSIANAVITSSSIPVLVIPDEATYHRPKHLALASDYKDFHPELLEPLKLMYRTYGADISVVHIDDENKLSDEETREAKRLEQALKNIPHSYHFIVADNPPEAIQKYVDTHEVDMLALIPRKHNFFERLFGKSQSKKLVFHTKIPLLAIPDID